MSETLISITITLCILVTMLLFVPCMELTARGCRKVSRSFRPGIDREDDPTPSPTSPLEYERTTTEKNSRSSNAA
jgi:hypothetical protein